VYRSKHVEPLMNGGIINSVTRLHLVGCLYWIILRCTDPLILKLGRMLRNYRGLRSPAMSVAYW